MNDGVRDEGGDDEREPDEESGGEDIIVVVHGAGRLRPRVRLR